VGSVFTSQSSTNGWEDVPVEIYPDGVTVTLAGACRRTYIDLAGWTKQELTTFIQGIDIQKANVPVGNASIVFEYDFLTTRKLTIEELSTFDYTPGFLPSSLSLQQLIYGQMRTYATNTSVPGAYITTATETYGSGVPTAMDKLHWTRVVIIGVPATSQVTIWPTNLVIQAISAKEKDLVWMERLRRSYVLQDEADV